MLERITADGWLMIPLLVRSVIIASTAAERFWGIQPIHILPPKVT